MNFSAFDLNLLRVFDALMRERSATRAGEQIGLSQPAVSAALQRLRDLLNDKLFVRQGNEMIPTPRAESMAPVIRTALAALEQLLEGGGTFDPRALKRVFTLQGADFFSSILVPELLQRLRTEAPDCGLRFLDNARGDVQALLRDDAIDMALHAKAEMPDFVEHAFLFNAPFRIVVRSGNRHLARQRGKAALDLDTFCALDWAIRSIDGSMSGLVDEALTQIGRSRRVLLAVPHFSSLLACVAESDVAAAVPVQMAGEAAAHRELRVFDMPFEMPLPEMRMYWHTRRSKDPAHAWMRAMVLDLCGVFRSAL